MGQLVGAIPTVSLDVPPEHPFWPRLEAQLETLSPQQLLAVGEEALGRCGLSRQKISSLRAIARAFEEGTLTPSQWERMSDREVTSQLVGIRGIGQWTAEMFPIFPLHRPDVLPLSDLGLLNKKPQP